MPQGLSSGAFLADYFIAEFGGESVDVLEVEIKTERVSARHKPAFHRIRQMEISAAAVRQQAVAVRLAGRRAMASDA